MTEKGSWADRPSLAGNFAPLTPDSYPAVGPNRVPVRISLVFALLVAVTLVAGYALYAVQLSQALLVAALVVFVAGGWVVSLCLHEFGHALTAFLGGDHGVVSKGYLTLNPLKYTHGMFSILLPLVFLAMGGIGLPGGAVYINPSAIRSRGMRSLTSAAGPLASGVCASLLLIPFVTGLVYSNLEGHTAFWAGLALLAFLQLTAIFFNLLPVPGLDGFGILSPYLPETILRSIGNLRGFTFLLIFLLFFNDTPISRGFWRGVAGVGTSVHLDFRLVYAGLNLFQFWAR
jgi:Zn-dependent protease